MYIFSYAVSDADTNELYSELHLGRRSFRFVSFIDLCKFTFSALFIIRSVHIPLSFYNIFFFLLFSTFLSVALSNPFPHATLTPSLIALFFSSPLLSPFHCILLPFLSRQLFPLPHSLFDTE